jgi:hypothetical protein
MNLKISLVSWSSLSIDTDTPKAEPGPTKDFVAQTGQSEE